MPPGRVSFKESGERSVSRGREMEKLGLDISSFSQLAYGSLEPRVREIRKTLGGNAFQGAA